MIFLLYLWNFHNTIRNENDDLSVLKKRTIRWYCLYHGTPCLLITKKFLFWNFTRWKIRSFCESKSWSKDDIYWLLKNSCFQFLWGGKYGVFVSKIVDERWYLLITWKFLFPTFQWLEIRSFFQPKSWWKDDIYSVFFSFPWYSRTWKIWFFVQLPI